MPEVYEHPTYKLCTVLTRYSDSWVVQVHSSNEQIAVHPRLLRMVGGGSDIETVKVEDLGPTPQLKAARLRINTCSPTALADFGIDGIGPKRAAQVCTRRPATGYVDYEQMEQINSDISVAWSAIAQEDLFDFSLIPSP